MGIFKDITGQTFGRLTVIGISHRSNKKIFWNCKCLCGNKAFVAGNKLKSGWTQSCGCLQKERAGKAAHKHGLRKSRFYGIWKGMLKRCYDPRDTNYHNYGGRGITVCEDWKNSIEFFDNWCNNSEYSEGLTLDRIEVNGNYEPDNCQWATMREQANNKQNTVYVYVNGVQHTVSDIHRLYGMSKTCVHKFSKQYENFSDAIKQWNLNKLLVKNQWNTTRTNIK